MNKTKLTNYMRKSAGYTIDQTILIVAVIAVLITLIIASVGWDLLNRTSGTKFASYLKQIEEANGAFYARQGVWPHIAVEQDGVVTGAANLEVANITVLASNSVLDTTTPSDYSDRWKPYLNGFDLNDATTPYQVEHEFGTGGLISQTADILRTTPVCEDGANHLVIQMNDVPLTEVVNADETIDGEINSAEGRLKYTNQTASLQTVTYCANLLN